MNKGILAKVKAMALLVPAGRLLNIAQKKNVEHLHCHSAANSATIALLAKILGDLTYSVTLHGPLEMYGGGQLQKWQNASFGIAVSDKLGREILTEMPSLPASKIHIAPMGVDLNLFKRKSPYRFPAEAAVLNIVTCGRLHFGKGHQELIEAVSILCKSGNDVKLTIMGEGPYKNELESLIKELNLSDRIRLLGAVSELRVRDELENASLFALASHDEAIGVAIMEAMAMELPVIATDVGGVHELIRNGTDGLLVQPYNPQAIADAVTQMMTDPDFVNSATQSALQRVQYGFSSRKSAEVIYANIAKCDNETLNG